MLQARLLAEISSTQKNIGRRLSPMSSIGACIFSISKLGALEITGARTTNFTLVVSGNFSLFEWDIL